MNVGLKCNRLFLYISFGVTSPVLIFLWNPYRMISHVGAIWPAYLSSAYLRKVANVNTLTQASRRQSSFQTHSLYSSRSLALAQRTRRSQGTKSVSIVLSSVIDLSHYTLPSSLVINRRTDTGFHEGSVSDGTILLCQDWAAPPRNPLLLKVLNNNSVHALCQSKCCIIPYIQCQCNMLIIAICLFIWHRCVYMNCSSSATILLCTCQRFEMCPVSRYSTSYSIHGVEYHPGLQLGRIPDAAFFQHAVYLPDKKTIDLNFALWQQ